MPDMEQRTHCMVWTKGDLLWEEPILSLPLLFTEAQSSHILFEANGQRHQMGLSKVPLSLSYFLT